jgi:hypothetical protein
MNVEPLRAHSPEATLQDLQTRLAGTVCLMRFLTQIEIWHKFSLLKELVQYWQSSVGQHKIR